jgi:sarcosine oxidase delta subunit
MRLRLNQEYRNKIANRMRVHIEAEDTQEKEKYFVARENIKGEQDKAWNLAHTIVRRHYTESDVEKARYLQNKFENVNTVASDSCFHLGYNGEVESRDTNTDRPIIEEKRISHHFDFKIDGGINGQDSGRTDNDFGYAYFRDELKAQEGCNPDINIEMSGKDRNPHQTKFQDANNKYLGTNGGRDNQTSYSKEWNDDYKLDLIGREYCRDRQLDCSKQEYDTLMVWQIAKGNLIQCHSKWITSVLNQMKEIKIGLKGYRYLDEGLELATELGLNINESEIIRTNSTGLTIYNPKNLADRIKAMKNTEKTREQKIAERIAYQQAQAQSQSVN